MPIGRRGSMPEAHALARQLGAGRVAIAGAIMAAPVPAARLLGADSATAARITWLTRMIAVRDGVLGVGALASARDETAGWGWLLGGAASDALDSLVIFGAIRNGRMRGALPIALVCGAAGAAGIGTVTAARLRRSAA